jgi:ankyrin repeat protein
LGSSLSVIKSIVRRAGVVAINQTDQAEYTPLMYAAEYDRPEVAEFLIACGASETAKNKLSHTASELADWYGHFSVLKVVDADAWTMATKALETQKKKQQAKAAEAKAASDAASEADKDEDKGEATSGPAPIGADAAASAASASLAAAGASSSSSSSAKADK